MILERVRKQLQKISIIIRGKFLMNSKRVRKQLRRMSREFLTSSKKVYKQFEKNQKTVPRVPKETLK